MNLLRYSVVLTIATLLAGQAAFADGNNYSVTVTNLTRGQSFTPILVASHEDGLTLFTAGTPAGSELAALAEGGDTMPLSDLLAGMEEVNAVATSGGILAPGDSVTVVIAAGGKFNRISLAAMLIPTNDAFVSVQGMRVPDGRATTTAAAVAYDAGSEPNDELCVSIPGPVCAGEGGSPGVGGEDFIHVHAGIHGIADLDAAEFDWRNPVAHVTIQRADN